MNKTEKLTPKVYVFDINPGNDEATKDLVIGRLGTISKIISSHHYFVLLSHSSLRVLKKITHDAKITKGYIVSDSGARIYDIGRKKIIYEKPIDKTSCLNIIHSIAMLNMLCLASSSLTEFSYSFDPLSSTSLNRLH
ncbi:MAG: HAD hydrolase family protein, partial [Mycoplasmoidaceae bacterium]|nr:HAD hydrolase family protein [Mycoplasmoidaceae bacterium]